MKKEPTLNELINQFKQCQRMERKFKAQSNTQEKVEKEEKQRLNQVKKLTVSLSANLPEPTFNPNEIYYSLRSQIVDAAFFSALESGVVFKRMENEKLKVTKGSESLIVKPNDLKEQISILINWSGLGLSLKDDSGKMPDSNYLYDFLILRAAKYERKLQKLKSSEEHLSSLVETIALKKLEFGKGLKRVDALDSLTNHLDKTSKVLGMQFSKDMSGNLYLQCSDDRFSATKLNKIDIEPFFQAVIDNSPVAGKLSSIKDAQSMIIGFMHKQPRK